MTRYALKCARNRFMVSTALLLSSLGFLSACGGGGGGGGGGAPQETTLVITSSPDLDGPVASSASVGAAPDQRPTVGDTFGPDVQFLHALFSFETLGIPAGAEIVSATMKITSISKLGDPGQMLGGVMAFDHVRYGTFFPNVIGDIDFILQSGIAVWNDVNVLGERTFDVTNFVKIDRLAGRGRTQFRLRGLNATDNDAQADFVVLAGGENTQAPETLPTLTVVYRQ